MESNNGPVHHGQVHEHPQPVAVKDPPTQPLEHGAAANPENPQPETTGNPEKAKKSDLLPDPLSSNSKTSTGKDPVCFDRDHPPIHHHHFHPHKLGEGGNAQNKEKAAGGVRRLSSLEKAGEHGGAQGATAQADTTASGLGPVSSEERLAGSKPGEVDEAHPKKRRRIDQPGADAPDGPPSATHHHPPRAPTAPMSRLSLSPPAPKKPQQTSQMQTTPEHHTTIHHEDSESSQENTETNRVSEKRQRHDDISGSGSVRLGEGGTGDGAGMGMGMGVGVGINMEMEVEREEELDVGGEEEGEEEEEEEEEEDEYAAFTRKTVGGGNRHLQVPRPGHGGSSGGSGTEDSEDDEYVPGGDDGSNYNSEEDASYEASSSSSSEQEEMNDPQEERFYRQHALAWITEKKVQGADPVEALAELGMDVMQRRLQAALQLPSSELWAGVERQVRKLFRFYYRQLPKSVIMRPQEADEPRLPALSLEGIADYIKSGACRKIVMVTGAGISTAAGIPDFRSPGTGLYHNLQKYNLPYPQAIFEIDFFKVNPAPFVMLAKELYPGTYKPTVSHYFSRLLMEKGLLGRHYTQNIDTLERVAGIDGSLLVEAHGSFNTAHCIMCKKEYDNDYVKDLIFADYIPTCEFCHNWIKPDIVFFGEGLPRRFSECAEQDFTDCDLMIVAGTSLKVQPFASVIDMVNHTCPRLLINRELCGEAPRLYQILGFRAGFEFSHPDNVRDVAEIGSCDDGFIKLAGLLGWKDELLSLVAREHAMLEQQHMEEARRRAALSQHDPKFYSAHVPVSRYRRSVSQVMVCEPEDVEVEGDSGDENGPEFDGRDIQPMDQPQTAEKEGVIGIDVQKFEGVEPDGDDVMGVGVGVGEGEGGEVDVGIDIGGVDDNGSVL